MKKITVRSVGCKLNQAETEQILDKFREAGFAPARKGCDLCIINTCTVTEKADRKSRTLVARLGRENPGAKIVLTGCYATTDPAQLGQACPSAIIVPNKSKDRILEKTREAFFPSLPVPVVTGSGSGSSSRARPFVKIQDGCDRRCSYCKVWMARGPSRSIPAEKILEQARGFAANGFAEIVLTGVNISDYRDGQTRLAGLLKKLCALRLPLRFRLASLEPRQIDDGLLDAVSDPAVCDHFHLSLQSGSGEILDKMNRPCSPDKFEKTVALLKKARPDAGIGADIIVGFPGETHAHFKETETLVRSLKIPFLHAFRYSDRQGTAAAALGDKIDERTKTARRRILTELQQELELDFRMRFMDRVLEIVVEGRMGLSSNYIAVDLPEAARELRTRMIRVRITGASRKNTTAQVLEKP